MAEDVTEMDELPNHCCLKWKEKYSKLKERYSKLEEGRNALRKGLSILEPQISKLQTENVGLKKALEDERNRRNLEKEERAKESEVRVALENEVSSLKSERLSFQPYGDVAAQRVDQEISDLRNHISKCEVEMNSLKELLEKEGIRADAEKRKAEAERKKADEAARKVKAENNRVNEEKRLSDIERRKTKELSLQLEALKCEVDETKSKLAVVTTKFEETKDKLNAESLKTTMERKRADIEMAKAEDQRKIAEANWKKLMVEKRHTDNLSQQLEKTGKRVKELEEEVQALVPKSSAEEAHKKLEKVKKKMVKEKKQAKLEKKKAEKQRQAAEAYKKVAMVEKHQLDEISHELRCYKKRLNEVQEEINNLMSSKKLLKSSSLASGVCTEAETAEMKLLRKQLKFEKTRVKHAKKVAKMERVHNQTLGKEVLQLKQDLVQFWQRLDTLGNYVLQRHDDLGKLGNSILSQGYFDVEACQRNLNYGNLNVKPNWTCTTTGGFETLEQNRNCNASLPPISGNIYTKSNAGIGSKLEPPKQGSNSDMLRACVVDMSSASFSERPLPVSKERGAFSVNNSPDLTEEIQNRELIPSRLSSDTKKSYNEKLAVRAETSVGSPIKSGAAASSGNQKKRKGVPDAVTSIKYLDSASQDLHQHVQEKFPLPHRVLDSNMDKPVQENRLLTAQLPLNMCKEVKSSKRRKSSARQSAAVEHLCDTTELRTSHGASGIERSEICKNDSSNTADQTGTALVGKDGTDGLSKGNEGLPRNFCEMLDSDPMRLLDLDDSLDEQRYQNAIARPISPTIPQINKFQHNETPEVCKNIPSTGTYAVKNNPLQSYGCDVINLEIDSNKQTIDRLGSPELLAQQKNRFSDGMHEGQEINRNSAIAHDCKISRVGRNLDLACNDSMDQDSLIPYGSSDSTTSTEFLRYYIVSSNNNDSSSILRIFQRSNCLSQFSEVSSPVIFAKNILLALQKCDDLSAKERVCSFVSLLLCYLCKISKQNCEENDCYLFVDSFAQKMRAVLSDVDTRRMFVEFCNMHELLSLMEDFLVNRRVLVYDKASVESNLEYGSGFKIVSGDDCLFLSVQAVPMKFLVAGGVLIASICAETNQIGFVCELSYNMFIMQKSNRLLVVRFLHLFAHLCGSKYFNTEGYDLQMSVLKSLVVFLEKLNSSIGCCPCFPSALDAVSKNSIWSKCPFSESVASLDVIVTMLLKELQGHTLGCSPLCPKEAFDWSIPGVPTKGDRTEEISGDWGSENLVCSVNMLSLLELVASLMNWEWTFDKVISPLLKMMESCIPDAISTAIITLLGQLGRDAVDAKGYQDPGVNSLRDWLSTFICQKNPSGNFGLPIQFASVTALLGLIDRSFQEVIEANIDVSRSGNQSNALKCIRNWFSSLDAEQQSPFCSLSSSIRNNSSTSPKSCS